MSKFKTFWSTFKQSLTNPGYYPDILKSRLSFSLKYLFGLIFCIIFLKTLLFSVTLLPVIPKLPEYAKTGKNILKNLYPSNLTVTINKGQLRTNVDEPYVIPFPKEFNIFDMSLAVIDTKTTIHDPKIYHTVFLVTKEAVSYPDESSHNGYTVQRISDMKGYSVINRDVYENIIQPVLPLFDRLPRFGVILLTAFVILGTAMGSFFYFVLILFYLSVYCLLLLFISKNMKMQLSYKSVYHLSLHGITFSLIFDFFKSSLAITIPFTFILPFIIWMIIVFQTFKKNHVPDIQAPASS